MLWLISLLITYSLASLVSPHVTLDDQSPQYQVSFHNNWAADELLNEPKSLYVIKDNTYHYACNVSSPGDWLEYEKENETLFDSQSSNPEQEKKDAVQTIRLFVEQRINSSEPAFRCVDLAERYWAYRYCYNHEILQFHYNQGLYMKTGILSPSEGSPTYRLASVGHSPYDKLSDFELIKTKDGSKYLTQVVYNGSTCDLTGDERITTLHYKCNSNLKNPKIDSIEELQTCQYKMVISAPQFCENPTFRPARDMTTANVSCFPIKQNNFEDTELPFKHEPLDLNNVSLKPVGFGVFLGVHKSNLATRPSPNNHQLTQQPKQFLLTHRVLEVDPENPEIENKSRTQILADVAQAFSFLIQNKRLVTPVQIKPTRVIESNDKFLYTAELYGLNMKYLDKIMISQEDGGFIVAYFEDEEDIVSHYVFMNGNFVSFNGMDVRGV